MKSLIILVAILLSPFVSLQAEDSKDFTKFKEAIDAFDVSRVRELLSDPNVNSNALGRGYGTELTTPLGYFLSISSLIGRGLRYNRRYEIYMQFLNAFLDSKSVDINFVSGRGRSLLHRYIGNIARLEFGEIVIEELLNHPDMRVANLRTPILRNTFLHELFLIWRPGLRIRAGYIDVIVSHKKFNSNLKNHIGDLPIHTAARHLSSNANLESIRFLIYSYRSSLHQVTDLGKTVSDLLLENKKLSPLDVQRLRGEIADILNNKNPGFLESMWSDIERCFG